MLSDISYIKYKNMNLLWMFMFLFFNTMLCLRNKLHSRKKYKELFIKSIVIVLFYLFVLPRACEYGDSILILLFYFVLKSNIYMVLKWPWKLFFSFSFKQTYRIFCWMQ